MQRQRGELVLIGAALSDLNDGPAAATRGALHLVLHHLIQVDQIATALEQAS